jgi:RND family efflux transporter MFP subunit
MRKSKARRPGPTVWIAGLAGILLGISGFSGCKDEENKYVAPPPPKVTVSHPLVQPLTEYLEMTGNTQAFATVQLTARVEGYLSQIGFKDGAVVKKDTTLFVIEQPPYQAKVDLAEATVASCQAKLLRATQEYRRQQQLIKQSATSQSEVEKWQAEQDAAQAALDEAKANLEIAKINLSYTVIKAPFLGRVDRHLVDLGNLVGPGQATLLSTIYRIDPIYAYFNVNEKDLVRAMDKDAEDGRRDLDPFPVYLAIEGEEGYPNKGTLDYTSTALDTSTGTLLLRGIFDNPLNGGIPKMLPGMFVRVRIPLETVPDALFVSERAIGVDQAGHYVLVVNDKNVVEQRTVRIGSREHGMRAVREGLKKEDWLVVNGIQSARPGAVVTPVQEQAQAPSFGRTDPQHDTKSASQSEAKPASQPERQPKDKKAGSMSSKR